MTRTRIATAAILTREARTGTSTDTGTDTGADNVTGVQVLLARRSPRLKFFGGYWAFPGGVVDEADVVPVGGDVDGDDAHKRCALRELLEEVGFDPARATDADGTLRSRLLARETEAEAARDFAKHLARDSSSAALVNPIGRLTTPPFAPVLYRTRFVHIEAPEDFEPEIIEGELVDGAFRTAQEWLREWREGRILIAPPVIFMLEHLERVQDEGRGLDAFLSEVTPACEELERGKLHPIRNVPGIIMAPLATETLPPATTTNAYLVGEARFFVVDPAPADPAELQRLFELVDARIEGGRDFVGVLLTHHHPDHVGGADATAARYDVPVLAHRWTLDHLRLDAENQRALDEGVALPLGVAPDGSPGWTLTAYATPGHAPGHLVFRESRYGALIAGDLISTVSTIVIDPPEGHLATYIASLERMRDMLSSSDVVHPAHGPVVATGEAVFERFLEHRTHRLNALRGAIADGLMEEDDLLRRIYADVDERLLPIAARSLRAALELLAETGEAVAVTESSWRAK